MSAPGDRPRASVVIPTWNGLDLLRDALASLDAQRFRAFETIVVDNGSTDGTVEALAREWPGVRPVRFPENRGFAPAVNAGIRAARADIVVLLNNDAVADPGFLGALVAAMDADPGLGSCAAKVLVAEDPGRIDSAGIRLGLFASQVGHGERDDRRFAAPRDVFAPSGGAAAYRVSALEAVGGFDDRFFAYFEDADLGCRLRLAGYGCRFVPGAVVRHRGSATARRVPEWKFFLLARNGLFVFFQNMPLRRLVPWAPLVVAWPFVRARVDGVRLRVATRAVGAFVRDLPAVLERRARVRRLRRVSWSDFSAALAPPLTRSRQTLVPEEGPAAEPADPVAGSDGGAA